MLIKMSPRFALGRENVPCVAEVVSMSLKADFTDFYFTIIIAQSKHKVFLVLLVKFHPCFPYFAFYNLEVLFVFHFSSKAIIWA